MKLRLLIPSLLALEVSGRTIRGAKRTKRKIGVAGALERCYPTFTEYEECLMDTDDCEDLRDEYFDCMCEDCDLSLISSAEQSTVEERAAFSSPDNVTSSSFGTQMFVELCQANPDDNVLFSPLSVYRALEMLEDGATSSSDTKNELDRLLGPRQLRNEVKALEEFDTTGGDVQLNMATSVWARELKESYIEHMIDAHDSEVFALPATYTPVDDWIEEKTNGMIKKLMGDDALDPWTRALIVDAVYFKGTWTYSFDSENNVEGIFHVSDASEADVTFMKSSRKMEAVRASPSLGDAAFVALDYGEDAEFTAMFVLPESSDPASMQDVVDGLNVQPLSQLLDEASEIPVELKLPRFRLDFGPTQLKPVLQNMGMVTAFGDELGKFNRMSFDPQLYVEDIYHGACMDVNEEGTEAAAATVVVVNTRSQPRVTPFQLTFDRPFVVAIFHRTSGVPLFIAKVVRPDFT